MIQPNQAMYPFSELNLFPVDTAATTGAIDDPTQARQYWHDPAAAGLPPTQTMQYQDWDQNTGNQTNFTRTAAQAAWPNVPATYPAYVVNDSSATYQLAAFPTAIFHVSPANLILPADAALIATELGGTVSDATPEGYSITWNAETRRWLQITVAGVPLPLPAEALMIKRSQWGMWAPGAWGKDVNGQPIFTQAVDSGLPPVQVPKRALLSNETIIAVEAVPGIQTYEVERTDIAPAPSGTVDGFTADDRTTINNKLDTLAQLIANK